MGLKKFNILNSRDYCVVRLAARQKSCCARRNWVLKLKRRFLRELTDDLLGYSRILLIATYVIQFSTLSSNMFLKIFYVKPFSRYDDSKVENAWFLWIFTMSHSDLLIIGSRAFVLLRDSSFDSAENSLQNIVKKHAYRARLREKRGLEAENCPKMKGDFFTKIIISQNPHRRRSLFLVKM